MFCNRFSSTLKSAVSVQLREASTSRKKWKITPFIERREVYRQSIKRQRKQFAEEVQKEAEKKASSMPAPERLVAIRNERNERRRLRSEAKREGHLAHLAEVKARKDARKVINFDIWKARQAELAERKDKVDLALEEASKYWITEENLEEHIERVIDDFFIASDGGANATLRL